jgi:membrane protein required for colicin V production
MNWIDATILGVTAISVAGGVFRGALKTIFSFAGVLIGFVAACRESGAVGVVLERWLPQSVAAVSGFVFVFLGIATVFQLTGWLARKLLANLSLGWVDRGLGAGVGVLRAALLLGVLALVAEGLGPPRASREARTYPYALEAGRVLVRMIPEETLERLNWEALKKKLAEAPGKMELI